MCREKEKETSELRGTFIAEFEAEIEGPLL